MKKLIRKLKSLRGATLVEYGMLVALIAAIVVGVVTLLGTRIQGAFTTITNAL